MPAGLILGGLALLAARRRRRKGGEEDGGGGGGRRGRRGEETPLADALPKVPSVTETPTGISGPGATPEQVKAGGQTEAELGQGVVEAISTQSEAQFASDVGAQKTAEDFAGDVEGQVSDAGERIEGIQGDLTTDKADLDTELDTVRQDLKDVPQQVSTEFDRLKKELGTVGTAALAKIDTKESAAASQVMEGRSAAMQAAVQGIQGNINTAVAKIQSDPNLTSAQKQSMISQTRLAGASSIAPAIGANILEFNKLAADVATKFGSFTAQIETQLVSEEGAFGRAAGDAFNQATIASQEITGQLLGIQATSDAAHANAQSTLEGIRGQMEMTGNQLLLDNLPNLSEPVLNITDAASAAAIIGNDLLTRAFGRESTVFEQKLTMMFLQSNIGTPGSRVAEATFEGLASGGRAGGGIGLITGLTKEIFGPDQPTFQ